MRNKDLSRNLSQLNITIFTFKKIKFIVLIRKAIKEADLDEWNFDSLD